MPRGTLQLNVQIARHRTLQPLRRMAMTRLLHAGCAISIMIAIIPPGGRARSRNVLSAGAWFTASSASIHRRELLRFVSGQTELDPPAEEVVGEAPTVRPPVGSLRCQAILSSAA